MQARIIPNACIIQLLLDSLLLNMNSNIMLEIRLTGHALVNVSLMNKLLYNWRNEKNVYYWCLI